MSNKVSIGMIQCDKLICYQYTTIKVVFMKIE